VIRADYLFPFSL